MPSHLDGGPGQGVRHCVALTCEMQGHKGAPQRYLQPLYVTGRHGGLRRRAGALICERRGRCVGHPGQRQFAGHLRTALFRGPLQNPQLFPADAFTRLGFGSHALDERITQSRAPTGDSRPVCIDGTRNGLTHVQGPFAEAGEPGSRGCRANPPSETQRSFLRGGQ